VTQGFSGFPITAPDLLVNSSATSFADDIDVFASETTTELQNLIQDLTNRLVEVPGSNLDFGPNNTRGVGLFLYLSAPASVFAGLPGKIDSEFELDPRVLSSLTTVTQNPVGSQFPYTISIQVQSVPGVFGLTFGFGQQGLVPLPSA
jgi:hypothetical protein